MEYFLFTTQRNGFTKRSYDVISVFDLYKNKMKIKIIKKSFKRISPKLQPLSCELTDTYMNSWYFWNMGDFKMSF